MRRAGAVATAVAVAGLLWFAGLSDRQDGSDRPRIRDMPDVRDKRFVDDERSGINLASGGLHRNDPVGGHHNNRMEMNPAIADRISSLPGVGAAYVLLTDRNAYVAVTPREGGSASAEGSAETGRSEAEGAERPHTGSGMPSAGDGEPERGRPAALSELISAEVLHMAPQVERVYVSSSPDFNARLRGYALDVQQGRPIRQLIADFNAAVDRLFPIEAGLRSRSGRTGVR